MPSSSRIFRVPRVDEEGGFVLGEASPTGSKPLNVKLVATEGFKPYMVKLRHDGVAQLKDSKTACSDAEWEKILTAILLGGGPVDGVEASASVQNEESISISVRRRVAGINQRLGTVLLAFMPDEAIEVYDWCGAAMQAGDELRGDLAAAKAKVQKLESGVQKLEYQLEELVRIREEEIKELMAKFCILLNEKKVRVRKQQKLLDSLLGAGARTMLSDAAPTPQSPPHVPRKSCSGKRRAAESPSGDKDDDSDDFESITGKDSAARQESTPSPMLEDRDSEDQQTADEGDDGDGDADEQTADEEDDGPMPDTEPARRSGKVKGPGSATLLAERQRGKQKEKVKSVSSPLTRASVRTNTCAYQATPAVATGESETESDEL